MAEINGFWASRASET